MIPNGNLNKRPLDKVSATGPIMNKNGEGKENGEKTGNEKPQEVLQWVCEICEKATFNTFKEACEHELICVERDSKKQKLEEKRPEEPKRDNCETTNKVTEKPVPQSVAPSVSLTSDGNNLSMQWVCEWCNNALFKTYTETVEHEKICRAKLEKKTNNVSTSELSQEEPKRNDPAPLCQSIEIKPTLKERLTPVLDNAGEKTVDTTKTNGDAAEQTEKTQDTSDATEQAGDITHWVCEYCRTAVFDSYEKAVAHERVCKIASEAKRSNPSKTTNSDKTNDGPTMTQETKKIIHEEKKSLQKEMIQDAKVLEEKKVNENLQLNSKNEKKPKGVRWVCEVCNVAAFDTYIEACIHEIECKERQKKQKNAIPKAATPPPSEPEPIGSNPVVNLGNNVKDNGFSRETSNSALNQVPNKDVNIPVIPKVKLPKNKVRHQPDQNLHYPNTFPGRQINPPENVVRIPNFTNQRPNNLNVPKNKMNDPMALMQRRNPYTNGMERLLPNPNQNVNPMKRVLHVPQHDQLSTAQNPVNTADAGMGVSKLHDPNILHGSLRDSLNGYGLPNHTRAALEQVRAMKMENKLGTGSIDQINAAIEHLAANGGMSNQSLLLQGMNRNNLLNAALSQNLPPAGNDQLNYMLLRERLRMLDAAGNPAQLPHLMNNLQNVRDIDKQIPHGNININGNGDKIMNRSAPITLPPMDQLPRKIPINPAPPKFGGNIPSHDDEVQVLENGQKELPKIQGCTVIPSGIAKPGGQKKNESYRWLCECCEEKIFFTYTEAAAHEKECRAKKEQERKMKYLK